MSVLALLFISFGGAFSLIWLITYLPNHKTIFGKDYSPRLLFCKLLGPFDVAFTIILVAGAWVGLSTAATGISMMMYNVMTGIGLSVGVVFTKKILMPRWTKQYNETVKQRKEFYAKNH